MYYHITVILRSIVILLDGKVRSDLKNGDSTDKKMREKIIEDFTDIESTLDGLSLKDVSASYCFLREGVEWLYLALEKLNKHQKTKTKMNPMGTELTASSLSEEIQRLKMSSKMRFVSAQDCFKASRERATVAFNDKSLSINDRIMACKLRAAATILELGLEDPDAAITACQLWLKDLNNVISAFQGGLSQRLQLNNIIYFVNDFAYSSKSRKVSTWPSILRQNTDQAWEDPTNITFADLHTAIGLLAPLVKHKLQRSESLSSRVSKKSIWPRNDWSYRRRYPKIHDIFQQKTG